MEELQNMRTKMEQYRVCKDSALQKTISVPEMCKLLGLKKTESYWLVHRNFFKTEIIGVVMRIDIDSFEKWYANQVKHKKVNGEAPGKELKKTSYSFQEATNLLGVNNATLYEIWKKENRKTITVDFVMRIPKEEFEKWYEQQDVYKKADKMPTISDMEKDYIRFEEAAMLLDVMESEMLKLIRTSEYRNLFDIRIFNNKKWISRKSFQLFLNAQNEYRINKEDNETVADDMIAETKQYISRQEAAELAGVTASTITKWMQMKKFTCTGAGKVLRIHRMEFLNWLDEIRERVC